MFIRSLVSSLYTFFTPVYKPSRYSERLTESPEMAAFAQDVQAGLEDPWRIGTKLSEMHTNTCTRHLELHHSQLYQLMETPTTVKSYVLKNVLVTPTHASEASDYMQWVLLDEKEQTPFPFPIYDQTGQLQMSTQQLLNENRKNATDLVLASIEPNANVYIEAPQGKKRYFLNLVCVKVDN